MKKIIFLSGLIIIGILFPAEIKRGCLGVLILIDCARPPEKALMGRLVDGPTKTRVTVSSKGRTIHADLYRPLRQGRHFPLLLVHGVNRAGKDDEQIVLLANDLARAGLLVLVPDLPGIKHFRPRLSDAEDILSCFLFLGKSDQAGPRGGMIGVGLGAGPMLLAAAEPRIRDKVSVVATIGGYYDLRAALSFTQTAVREYGREHPGNAGPEAPLRWRFAEKNLDLLSSTGDRKILREIIEKLNHKKIAAAETLAASLGPEGRKLHSFLVNTDRERSAILYEHLPLPIREYLYQLSPARAIPFITASFIIIHGMDDPSFPSTESMRIADAVSDKGRVRLALLPALTHRGPIGHSVKERYQRYVLGNWRLFTAIYDLLEKGGMEKQ